MNSLLGHQGVEDAARPCIQSEPLAKQLLKQWRDEADSVLQNEAAWKCLECDTHRRRLESTEAALATMTVQRDNLARRITELEVAAAVLSANNGRINDVSCRFESTVISERQQAEIDRIMMNIKHEAEKKAHVLSEENSHLRSRIDDLNSEILALKEQLTIFKADFDSEREDRASAQGRIVALQAEVERANQRVAERDSQLIDVWDKLERAKAFSAEQMRVVELIRNGHHVTMTQRRRNGGAAFDETDTVSSSNRASPPLLSQSPPMSSVAVINESSELIKLVNSMTQHPQPVRSPSTSPSSTRSHCVRRLSPSTLLSPPILRTPHPEAFEDLNGVDCMDLKADDEMVPRGMPNASRLHHS